MNFKNLKINEKIYNNVDKDQVRMVFSCIFDQTKISEEDSGKQQ